MQSSSPLLTPVETPQPVHLLELGEKVLSTGSCFAGQMGEKLHRARLPVLSEPFGTVFNPLSLMGQLRVALQGNLPAAGSYLRKDDVWLNYHFHSDCYAFSEAGLAHQLAERLQQAGEWLRESHLLILTFGTALVYENQQGEVVANCHKMPGTLFSRRLLEVGEIVQAFEALLGLLPIRTSVLLTVSPVRHTKDTLPLNAVSKATLRLACHQICQALPERVGYFPSYEIMTDELRDYRYYQPDLIHPSAQAVELIWQRFAGAYLSSRTSEWLSRWEPVRQMLEHRPLHPGSHSHRRFLESLAQKLEALEQWAAPHTDLSAEKAMVAAQLEGFRGR